MKRCPLSSFGFALATVVVLLAGWPAVAGAQSLFGSTRPAFPVPRRPPAPTVAAGPRSDTVFVGVPPAYPAPTGTFVPLPAGGPPPPVRPPDERQRLSQDTGRDVTWSPGRLEVVTGLDESGRVVHALRYAPGRFEPSEPAR